MDNEKYRYSPPGYSPDEEGANQHVVSNDVFGNEENNAVRRACPVQAAETYCTSDQVQDSVMATGCGLDDCGDCQQWHAFTALEFGRCRHCSWCNYHCISWRLWNVYKLDSHSV